MEKQDMFDLGLVGNLAIIRKPSAPDKLLFVGTSQEHARWVRVITRGAAQTLWFHLTHILYPRAADQITPRAATAMLRPPDAPNLTTSFFVHHDKDKRMIKVQGIGSKLGWMMHFPMDEGYELWASLEDILDSV